MVNRITSALRLTRKEAFLEAFKALYGVVEKHGIYGEMPFVGTVIGWIYQCNSCEEWSIINQDLITLIFQKYKLQEPPKKCPFCGKEEGYILLKKHAWLFYEPHWELYKTRKFFKNIMNLKT